MDTTPMTDTTRRPLRRTLALAACIGVFAVAVPSSPPAGAASVPAAEWGDPYTVVAQAKAGDLVAPGTGMAGATVVRNLSYGPGANQLADLYLPKVRLYQRTPVIVFLHGGGWFFGDRTAIGSTDQITAMTSRGWAVVAVNYPLVVASKNGRAPLNPHPAQVHDVKRAVRWTRSIANQCVIAGKLRAAKDCSGRQPLSFDPSTVVLAGFSAGGHLSLLAGLSAGSMEPSDLPPALARQSSAVQAIVSFSPVTDMEHSVKVSLPIPTAALQGCKVAGRICNRAKLTALTPATWIGPKDPPVYLGYGPADPLLPPSFHALPIAHALGAALGAGRVWVDEEDLWADDNGDGIVDRVVAQGKHDTTNVNVTQLALFLDKVRTRQITAG